ncbi:MAG: DUF547 domain-containing protein [Leptolyngbyaceae cyanobacterium SL_7_1]|nr:DUF547 domain-containing protein [Leptolyngbyaceae cyanobacterium SL_7_1]
MRIQPLLIVLPLAVLLANCSAVLNSRSPAPSTSAESPVAANTPFRYDSYAQVLEQYVDEQGLVDYVGLQADADGLKRFNQSIGAVPSATYEAWSDAEKMAFLINAYNSFTLESIIDQNPLKASIRDIPGVWRVRRFQVAGQSKTLDDIEHNTLRPTFQDPRIHAALNCTAISCPVLRQEPYTAEKLDAQLEEQVRLWLASPQGLQIDRANNQVRISQLFDWFGEDWLPNYGTSEGFTGNDKQRAALNFISQYVSEDDRAYLQQGEYELSYLDYDWTLNRQS